MSVRARLPRLNESLVLIRLSDGERYASSLQDAHAGRLAVAAPTDGRDPVVVEPGESWRVEYFDEGAVYRFDAAALSAAGGRVPVLWLVAPSRVNQIQRRAFARLEMRVPVVVWTAYDEGFGGPWSGHTVDLSGGGVRVALEGEPDLEGRLGVELSLVDGPARGWGRIVRVVEYGDERGRRRRVFGIAFVEIDSLDQDRIVGAVLKEQQRRKSLGLE